MRGEVWQTRRAGGRPWSPSQHAFVFVVSTRADEAQHCGRSALVRELLPALSSPGCIACAAWARSCLHAPAAGGR